MAVLFARKATRSAANPRLFDTARTPRKLRPWAVAAAGLWLLLGEPWSARAKAQGSESFPATAEASVNMARATPSTEGALFLILPVGAQGIAMGRAMTALPSQESAFWNPAGLAQVHDRRFFLYRGDQLAGRATAFSFLVGRPSVGTLGVSYQELNVGDQRMTGPAGEELGSLSVRGYQGVVSFATELVDLVSVGTNFKIVQFRIGCRGQCLDQGVTATTYAVDAGLQATFSDAVPLRIGLMIAHLGPDLQVVNAEQADPLPVRARLAAAYDILDHFEEEPAFDLRFTVELEERWRNLGSPAVHVGTEVATTGSEVLSIRAGYAYGREGEGGAALGLGLRVGRFELGVARSLARTSLVTGSEPVHVSFGLVF